MKQGQLVGDFARGCITTNQALYHRAAEYLAAHPDAAAVDLSAHLWPHGVEDSERYRLADAASLPTHDQEQAVAELTAFEATILDRVPLDPDAGGIASSEVAWKLHEFAALHRLERKRVIVCEYEQGECWVRRTLAGERGA